MMSSQTIQMLPSYPKIELTKYPRNQDPSEILDHNTFGKMLSFLPVDDFGRCIRVSSRWRRLLSSNEKLHHEWRKLIRYQQREVNRKPLPLTGLNTENRRSFTRIYMSNEVAFFLTQATPRLMMP